MSLGFRFCDAIRASPAFRVRARLVGVLYPRRRDSRPLLPASRKGPAMASSKSARRKPGASGPRRYDTRLIQRGARLRRSPYFDATLAAGCKSYTVYNHTLLPSYYDDPEAEYWHLLEHAALWDVAVGRQVEVSGPDAFDFAQLLTPRDLATCAVGQGKYVVIVDEDGGILNDPVLMLLGEDRFWFSAADSDLLLWAKGVARNSAIDVWISEPDVSPLQVQGPKSKALTEDLFGSRVTSLEYYHFVETDLDGIPLVVTRTGWTGEVGYELYLLDGSRGIDLWDRVMKAGRKYDLKPAGPSDIRRIEGGFLNYGADMTLDDTPYDVGLGWTVDLDKDADFIGREALRRAKAEGPRRKLVGIEISGKRIEFNETKWPVQANGNFIGRVTSAIYSPRLKKNIGFANVPVEDADIGTELEVLRPDGPRSGVVVRKPFIDPGKEIPKR